MDSESCAHRPLGYCLLGGRTARSLSHMIFSNESNICFAVGFSGSPSAQRSAAPARDHLSSSTDSPRSSMLSFGASEFQESIGKSNSSAPSAHTSKRQPQLGRTQ